VVESSEDSNSLSEEENKVAETMKEETKISREPEPEYKAQHIPIEFNHNFQEPITPPLPFTLQRER
jgi:hypothetical protein